MHAPDATKIIRRQLMCDLTPDEKVRIADAAFAKQTEIDVVKADKSAAVADANAALKELRAAHERLSKAYMAGAEEREVQCFERAKGDGTIELVRLDTGLVVDPAQRGTPKQTSIFDAADKPKKGKGKTSAADAMIDDMIAHEAAAAPIERPGKACDGCSMADGNHHADCTVAHPDREVSDEPITAPASREWRGVAMNADGSERVFELTTMQAADVASGKAVSIAILDRTFDVTMLRAIPAEELEADAPDYTVAAEAAAALDTEEGLIAAISKIASAEDADAFHASHMRGAAWKAMPPAPRSRVKAAFREAIRPFGAKGRAVAETADADGGAV